MEFIRRNVDYLTPKVEEVGTEILELDQTRSVVYDTNMQPVFSAEDINRIECQGVVKLEIVTQGWQKWQLVACPVKTGKVTVKWYENSNIFSRWLASWKTMKIVVNPSRYKIFNEAESPSNAWSDIQVRGTIEFTFFRDLLTVIDGMRYTDAFANACKWSSTHKNQRLNWNPVFGDGFDGYNSVLREAGRLLKVGVKNYGVDCSRIETLLTQAEGIYTLRLTEMQNVMEELDAITNDQHVVSVEESGSNAKEPVDNDAGDQIPKNKVNAHSLTHWKIFGEFLAWIIADLKSKGHAGNPPDLKSLT